MSSVTAKRIVAVVVLLLVWAWASERQRRQRAGLASEFEACMEQLEADLGSRPAAFACAKRISASKEFVGPPEPQDY